LNFQSDCPRV